MARTEPLLSAPPRPAPPRPAVSHVSDLVGPEGLVYAVEFSHRSGRDLLNVAKKRTNIIPIIEDARHPVCCVVWACCVGWPPFASFVIDCSGD
jgi:hypothetical protein